MTDKEYRDACRELAAIREVASYVEGVLSENPGFAWARRCSALLNDALKNIGALPLPPRPRIEGDIESVAPIALAMRAVVLGKEGVDVARIKRADALRFLESFGYLTPPAERGEEQFSE